MTAPGCEAWHSSRWSGADLEYREVKELIGSRLRMRVVGGSKLGRRKLGSSRLGRRVLGSVKVG